jgi:two-component system nitrogen regulation response regulator GlnG
VIKQAMFNATGQILLPEFLPETLKRGMLPTSAAEGETGSGLNRELAGLIRSLLQNGADNIYQTVIDAVERTLLTQVLQHTHGHQTQASELLGLNRSTLRHKLRTLGLAVDKTVTEEGNKEVLSEE